MRVNLRLVMLASTASCLRPLCLILAPLMPLACEPYATTSCTIVATVQITTGLACLQQHLSQMPQVVHTGCDTLDNLSMMRGTG